MMVPVFATSLTGTVAVTRSVAGAQSAFDAGSVGINVLPLGTHAVAPTLEVKVIEITVEAADVTSTFTVSFMDDGGALRPPHSRCASPRCGAGV